MLTSMQKRPKLALPTLSAMLLLSLFTGPSPARSPEPLATNRAPGQVREVIAPAAATVASTLHYQADLELTCSGVGCAGDFPNLGSKRRLNVTRVTCIMRGTSGSTPATGYMKLHGADNSVLLTQYLPVDHSSSSDVIGYHTLNRAVDMQVLPKQHVMVGLFLTNGTAHQGLCSASGTLELLQ